MSRIFQFTLTPLIQTVRGWILWLRSSSYSSSNNVKEVEDDLITLPETERQSLRGFIQKFDDKTVAQRLAKIWVRNQRSLAILSDSRPDLIPTIESWDLYNLRQTVGYIRVLRSCNENGCIIDGVQDSSTMLGMYSAVMILDPDSSPSLRMRVAVKMVRPSQVEDRKDIPKDLLNELNLIECLDHENILPFVGLFLSEEFPSFLYVVSEWVPQGNVLNYLANNRKDAPTIILGLTHALEYVHSDKPPVCFHGDLKPTNVLVGTGPRALLTDFSHFVLEKRLGKPQDVPLSTISFRHCAPELLNSRIEDVYMWRADVYAFGLIAYECMTGISPFTSLRTFQLVELLKNSQKGGDNRKCPFMEAAPQLKEGISQALFDIFKNCWVPDPMLRPTMTQIRNDLAPLLANDCSVA